jgi:hypothetical protein
MSRLTGGNFAPLPLPLPTVVSLSNKLSDAHFWRLVGNCIVSPTDLWKY